MPARSHVIPAPVFEETAAYSLADLRALGFGKRTLRHARERGLPVRQLGRSRFVLGRDLIEFLAQQPPAQGRGEG